MKRRPFLHHVSIIIQGPNLQNSLRFIIRLSEVYRKVDLRYDLRGNISHGNIVSQFTNAISDDLTILQVNCT